MATVMTWLKARKLSLLACFRSSKLSMAYTHPEIRLVLAGRTTHRHESHIEGSNASCISPLCSYN